MIKIIVPSTNVARFIIGVEIVLKILRLHRNLFSISIDMWKWGPAVRAPARKAGTLQNAIVTKCVLTFQTTDFVSLSSRKAIQTNTALCAWILFPFNFTLVSHLNQLPFKHLSSCITFSQLSINSRAWLLIRGTRVLRFIRNLYLLNFMRGSSFGRF